MPGHSDLVLAPVTLDSLAVSSVFHHLSSDGIRLAILCVRPDGNLRGPHIPTSVREGK